MREIKKIIIHCTDSDDSLDIGVKQIRSWHTMLPPKGNGWSDVGYHYIIRRDGRIERGRQDETKGAHVRGHNSDSLGIVWVGKKQISDEQLMSLRQLLRGLMDKYDIEPFDIYGHNELYAGKTCPNLEMNFIRLQALFTDKGVNVDEI